jgi:hypothetical protein
LNQYAGITPESNDEALLQGGLQAAPTMLGKAGSMLLPFTGRRGAVAANNLAEKEGQNMIKKYKPNQASGPMFDQAYKAGAGSGIPMNETATEIQNAMAPISGKVSLSYAYGKVGRDIDVIKNELASGQPLSLERWQFLHTRLGKTIRDLRAADETTGLDEAKKLYGAMYKDLDTLAQVGGPGAKELVAAKQNYLREASVNDISKYIEKGMKDLRGQGADGQFNAAEIKRKLKDDQFYAKAFSADERKDIEKTLDILNTAPALPTPSSINAGSKRMNQRIAATTGGAASGAYVGSTLGEPALGAAIGGAAGFVARDVADAASNIAFAMKTETGRAMIRDLAKAKGGVFSPRNAAVLSAYAAALRNQPDTEMTRE